MQGEQGRDVMMYKYIALAATISLLVGCGEEKDIVKPVAQHSNDLSASTDATQSTISERSVAVSKVSVSDGKASISTVKARHTMVDATTTPPAHSTTTLQTSASTEQTSASTETNAPVNPATAVFGLHSTKGDFAKVKQSEGSGSVGMMNRDSSTTVGSATTSTMTSSHSESDVGMGETTEGRISVSKKAVHETPEGTLTKTRSTQASVVIPMTEHDTVSHEKPMHTIDKSGHSVDMPTDV